MKFLSLLSVLFGLGIGLISTALAHPCAPYLVAGIPAPMAVVVEKIAQKLPSSYLDPHKAGFVLPPDRRAWEANYEAVLGVHKSELRSMELKDYATELLAAAKEQLLFNVTDEQLWEYVLANLFNNLLIISPKQDLWEVNIDAVRALAMLGDYLFPFMQGEGFPAEHEVGKKIFWPELNSFLQDIGEKISLGPEVNNDLMATKVLAAIIPEISLRPQDPATFSVIASFATLAQKFFNLKQAAHNASLKPAEVKRLRKLYHEVYGIPAPATFPPEKDSAESDLRPAYNTWNRLYRVLREKLQAASFLFAPFTRGPLPLKAWMVESSFARLNSFTGLSYLMGHYAVAMQEMESLPWPEALHQYLANRWIELNKPDDGRSLDTFIIEENFLGMAMTLSFFYDRPEVSGIEEFNTAFQDLLRNYQQEQRYYFQYYEPVCDLQRDEVLPLLRFMQTTINEGSGRGFDERAVRPFKNIIQNFNVLLPRHVILGTEEARILAALKKRLKIKD